MGNLNCCIKPQDVDERKKEINSDQKHNDIDECPQDSQMHNIEQITNVESQKVYKQGNQDIQPPLMGETYEVPIEEKNPNENEQNENAQNIENNHSRILEQTEKNVLEKEEPKNEEKNIEHNEDQNQEDHQDQELKAEKQPQQQKKVEIKKDPAEIQREKKRND